MRLALAAALLLATGAAVAQQAPPATPGSKNTAAITGGTYQADPGHTLVTWTLDHLGLTPYTGIFGDVTGTLTFDPKNPSAARVEVSIPVTKVTVASEGLTAHLTRPGKDGAKPDFFGPDAPAATFRSTAVRVSGQTAKITGDLTFNGVTKPVTLDASFYGAGTMPAQMGGKEGLGFHATATIKRSDWAFGFGVPMVGDAVKLDIAAAFMK
jgi:polyisoprenoid-binding protein YceI